MKIAYFDCQYGAAGDMLLAGLIDAGVSVDLVKAELAKLEIDKETFFVRFEKTSRASIACVKLEVDVQANGSGKSTKDYERNLSQILKIIDNSRILPSAKELAKKIFTRLGQAEARVHGVTPDMVHFHEVGALDSIVDIVGFAIAYALSGIEQSHVSPLPLGQGHVQTRHGLFPVPAPAVVQLLADAKAPIASQAFAHECLTPTGAAILTTIASSYGPCPQMEAISAIGQGAGTFNPREFPNICRVFIGEGAALTSEFPKETIYVLETNLDDMSPQLISHAMAVLMAEGALDAAVFPAVMKKGRSGHMLQVISRPDDKARLEALILNQTSALGLRSYPCSRTYVKRYFQTVIMDKGDAVKIKIGQEDDGKVINVQPEFDDCVAYASKYNLPLKSVIQEALAKFNQQTVFKSSKA